MSQSKQSVLSSRRRIPLPKNLRDFGQRYGALTALSVLVIFDIIFTRNFSSVDAISNTLIQVTPTLILSIGMTLVIATGGIDISVGSIMAIAGVVAYLIFSGRLFSIQNVFLGTAIAILVALLVATLFGVVNGVLVTRFKVQPIVATLILLIGGRGIAEVLINGEQHSFLAAPIVTLLNGKILGFLPVSVLIMLIIVLFFAWLMSATAFSRYILAVGGNQSAARLVGAPVNRVLIAVYAISGLLAGITGLIAIAYTSAENPTSLGLGKELDAIAAVAVGGTPLTGGRATIWGTVIGALFIQLLHQTLISLNIPDDISRVITGLIILLAFFLQRQRNV